MTLSTPKFPHQRFWAKGKSMLMEKIFTPGSPPASLSKRRVWASHTGVSSDGTTLKMRTESPVWAKFTFRSEESTTSKSGALSPGFNSGPASGRGLPLRVVVRVELGIGGQFSRRLVDLVNDFRHRAREVSAF